MSNPLIAISRRQALSFAAFLVLYQFLTYIANDMIMPGMLHVVQSFNGPESAIATSLTVYILGGASLQLFLGPVSDSVGRRPVMLFGALLFFVFTGFIACSNSMFQFLLARYFEGMGLCFIGVIGYATLQEIFEEMAAIRLTAILGNVASLAPLLGPLAGTIFILYFNWRGIFICIAVLALVAFWGLWRFMPEPVGAVKHDGKEIPKTPLAPGIVAKNYKLLLTNPAYLSGAIAAGLLSAPCAAWIAISPVIIVSEAKLSVLTYALWQLPIFSAGIFGNWCLHYLTKRYSIKQIITFGSTITVIGLTVTALAPLAFGKDFRWLMPGFIIYGFSLGIASAPLNRYILFSTPVSKGTAYAMISLISMCCQAIGIEIANYFYAGHDNSYFGLYCFATGLVYAAGVAGAFSLPRYHEKDLLGASAS
ncbi:MFS transporter [Legionella dresdenensis]|uniref:MFS transporter n=1 Tax=Legionella dresdenensis TaxID=450200 RepID=A0ABV8CD33_9GAMM